MEKHFAIGIDLGGTRVKIGLVRNGGLVATSVIGAEAVNGLGPNLPRIKSVVDQLIRNHTDPGEELRGVGLAFPGLVDPRTQKVLSTNKKYDDALDLDLAGWVAEGWNTPFFIDNDARMAAVGEWKLGAGRGSNDLVMMTIGTGIGTAAIINGQLLRGRHFQAGCLGGHFTVNYSGATCTCGNIGCVEAEASSWNIAGRIRSAEGFGQSLLSAAATHDFETLFSACRQGDRLARQVVGDCINAWSAGIINLVHAYDPEVVILGGGILRSKEDIIPPVQQRVHQYAWTPWGKVAIRPSELMDGAAILGVTYCLAHPV